MRSAAFALFFASLVLAAMRMLIPPAYAAQEHIDEDIEAFYEYYALHTEPWDGPAGVVTCDGRHESI